MLSAMIVAALILLAGAPGPAPESASGPASQSGADIVVRASRGRCEIAYAGSKLEGKGLQKLADGWPAGRPLRVLEPRRADRKCLTHIALVLAEKGFNNLEFVDPPQPE